MEGGKHPTSNERLYFDPEAVRNCLQGLSLTCNQIGNYMIVMESDVNIILSGQPYIALMLLFEVKTGKYFARIWNQTVMSGEAATEEELSEACSTFFLQGRPCLGCPADDTKDNTTNDFIISQTPIRRKYSRACLKRLGQGFPSDVNKCSECLKLMDFKLEADSEYDEIKESLCLSDFQTKTEEEFSEDVDYQEAYVEEGVYPQDICPPEETFHEEPSMTVARLPCRDKSISKYRHKKKDKYSQIIEEALMQAEDHMLCFKDIYKYIEDKHPYFDHGGQNMIGLQNTIRTILSRNPHFQNMRAPNKGRVWTFNPVTDPSATDDGFQIELDDQKDYLKEGVNPQDIFPPEEPSREKPSQTVRQLITHALRRAKTGMLSADEICYFISQKFPYYDTKVNDWQDEVRKQLSVSQFFKEIGNTGSEGSRWALLRSCEEGKPSLNFSQLIEEALGQAEDEMLPLCDIISYIEDKYPFYRSDDQGWKTSIRHSLSGTARFQLVPAPHLRGKSGMWKICHDGSLKKKKKTNRNPSNREASDQDARGGEHVKPAFTYAQLITQAFEHSRGRMLSLHAICLFISETYPYYSLSEKRWKETVGQILSINSEFQRIGGKRNSWKLIDGTEIECPQCKMLFNSDDDEYRNHECRQVDEEHVRPALTYPEMVREAFEHSENRVLPSKKICSYICETYPYFSSKRQFLEKNIYTFLSRSVKYRRIGDKFQGGSWRLIDGTEVECPKCGKLFRARDDEYYNHMKKKHSYGVFTCSSGCNFKAEYVEDIIAHFEAETHHKELFVMCPSCEEQIPTKELETHYKTCVLSKLRTIEKQLCTICGKHIMLRRGNYSYKLHMKKHLREQVANEENSDVSLYHYCDQCGKRYANKQDLAQHIRGQHRGVKLRCEVCSMEFKTRSEKWAHKNLMHSNDEKYECKKCNIRYGTMSRLKRHLMTHEAPQFECKYCGKKNVHKDQHLRHEKIHIGEKTLKCPVEGCGKMWIDSSALHKHKRQVHKIFGKMRKRNPIPVTMKAL